MPIDWFNVRLSDDTMIGFGLDHFNETAGFGPLSLRERARHIGGSLTIDSAPGRGSCFTLRVPLSLVKSAETQRHEVGIQRFGV